MLSLCHDISDSVGSRRWVFDNYPAAFVLPKFTAIFAEIGSSLPLTTQILLAVSNGFRSFWWVGLAILVSAYLAFKAYVRSEGGRYQWDVLKLKMMMEDVIRKLETARFCRTHPALFFG